MNKIILFLMFFTCSAYSKCVEEPIRVAIIDTGLDLKDPRFSSLICKDGHNWDFVLNKPIEKDFHGHGTHIAGLIKEYAGKANFCFLIYRYYNAHSIYYNDNLYNEIKAITQAVKDGAVFINISGGGLNPSAMECEVIKQAPGTTFILAAGNNGISIDPPSGYYPACCGSNNIIIVGALEKNGAKLDLSNYGKAVTEWELGSKVSSTFPGGEIGTMSGTSQSTAIATGKAVAKRINSCKVVPR